MVSYICDRQLSGYSKYWNLYLLYVFLSLPLLHCCEATKSYVIEYIRSSFLPICELCACYLPASRCFFFQQGNAEMNPGLMLIQSHLQFPLGNCFFSLLFPLPYKCISVPLIPSRQMKSPLMVSSQPFIKTTSCNFGVSPSGIVVFCGPYPLYLFYMVGTYFNKLLIQLLHTET